MRKTPLQLAAALENIVRCAHLTSFERNDISEAADILRELGMALPTDESFDAAAAMRFWLGSARLARPAS